MSILSNEAMEVEKNDEAVRFVLAAVALNFYTALRTKNDRMLAESLKQVENLTSANQGFVERFQARQKEIIHEVAAEMEKRKNALVTPPGDTL